MRGRKTWYWISTAFVAFELVGGGVGDVVHLQPLAEGMRRIGYPSYVLTLLGLWKILGGVVLLLPGTARLKEWAYAGTFFLMTGAAISHGLCGEWLYMIVPLLIAAVAMVSWALRPADRTLGAPFHGRTREAITRNIAAANL